MSRDALFDLAVNRAASYLRRLGLMEASAEARARHLEPWYLKTRFAYRLPMTEVLERLERCPGPSHYWRGGSAGGWQEGENPRP